MPRTLASIEHATEGAITFAVDDVAPATDLETHGVCLARDRFAELVGRGPMIASSLGDDLALRRSDVHPLVQAVHHAFARHHTLELCPDAVWLTIAQGFERHVHAHAEALRGRLVRHAGKKDLIVESSTAPETTAQWSQTIDAFTRALADDVGQGYLRLLECDFSTTTPDIRAASRVVMMGVFERYYDFRIMCVCGIPRVTLLGTPDDWRRIRMRVERLAEFDLEWWTSRLLPICDRLIETAEGRPPLTFWQNIYKPKHLYARELVSGWLADLFPYLKGDLGRNPVLDKRRALDEDVPEDASDEDALKLGDGIDTGDFPNGLSDVPISLQLSNGNERAITLVAGFVAPQHHPETGAMRAKIGWGVFAPGEVERFVQRVDGAHGWETPHPEDAWTLGGTDRRSKRIRVGGVPALLVRLNEEERVPVLFGGTPWELRGHALQPIERPFEPDPDDPHPIRILSNANRFAETADGRALFYEATGGTFHVYVCRPEAVEDAAEWAPRSVARDVRKVSDDVTAFFHACLDHEGGYFFDAEGFDVG